MPTIDIARRRAWRTYADVRRRIRRAGTAATALSSLGDPARRPVEEWNARTAEHFDRYRADHRPAADHAAVVCVSRRPAQIDHVITNVLRQRDVDVEFTLVTNDDGFDLIDLDAALSPVPGARIIRSNPADTLGAGLNAAMRLTEARFVAKFDDDDHYGEHYLVDALRAHSYAGAAVVGKHSYYAIVGSPPVRHLRFPGHDFSYSSTLAGGTLVIDRSSTADLEFEDRSLGEDRAFLAACHRRGLSTFAADRFNFVQYRGGDNTWRIDDSAFLVGAPAVDESASDHRVDR